MRGLRVYRLAALVNTFAAVAAITPMGYLADRSAFPAVWQEPELRHDWGDNSVIDHGKFEPKSQIKSGSDAQDIAAHCDKNNAGRACLNIKPEKSSPPPFPFHCYYKLKDELAKNPNTTWEYCRTHIVHSRFIHRGHSGPGLEAVLDACYTSQAAVARACEAINPPRSLGREACRRIPNYDHVVNIVEPTSLKGLCAADKIDLNSIESSERKALEKKTGGKVMEALEETCRCHRGEKDPNSCRSAGCYAQLRDGGYNASAWCEAAGVQTIQPSQTAGLKEWISYGWKLCAYDPDEALKACKCAIPRLIEAGRPPSRPMSPNPEYPGWRLPTPPEQPTETTWPYGPNDGRVDDDRIRGEAGAHDEQPGRPPRPYRPNEDRWDDPRAHGVDGAHDEQPGRPSRPYRPNEGRWDDPRGHGVAGTPNEQPGSPSWPHRPNENRWDDPRAHGIAGAHDELPGMGLTPADPYAPSYVPQGPVLAKADAEHLLQLSAQFKFEIRGGLCAITDMPAEAQAAGVSWRLVYDLDVDAKLQQSRFRFEMCRPQEQGRVVTKIQSQYVYGYAVEVDGQASAAADVAAGGQHELLCDNGGLTYVKVQNEAVVDVRPAGEALAKEKGGLVIKCDGVSRCEQSRCEGAGCSYNLVASVKAEASVAVGGDGPSASASAEASITAGDGTSASVRAVVSFVFEACQSPAVCNSVRTCAEDNSCMVQQPAQGAAPAAVPEEQVRASTVGDIAHAIASVNAVATVGADGAVAAGGHGAARAAAGRKAKCAKGPKASPGAGQGPDQRQASPQGNGPAASPVSDSLGSGSDVPAGHGPAGLSDGERASLSDSAPAGLADGERASLSGSKPPGMSGDERASLPDSAGPAASEPGYPDSSVPQADAADSDSPRVGSDGPSFASMKIVAESRMGDRPSNDTAGRSPSPFGKPSSGLVMAGSGRVGLASNILVGVVGFALLL